MKRLVWLAAVVFLLAVMLVSTLSRSLAESPSQPVLVDATTEPHVPSGDVAKPGEGQPLASEQALPISLDLETDLMYQRTDGPPGKPAAKQCEGCMQVIASVALGSDGGPRSATPAGSETLSGWEILVIEDFEGQWPASGGCWQLYDRSEDGWDRTWGSDDHRSHSGDRAAWPGAGGQDAIDPPDDAGDLNSWMICGPFDLTTASSAYAAFWLWSEVQAGQDEVFFGVGDGADEWFQGYSWDASETSWTEYTIYFPGYTGGPAHDAVWLAWNFESDASNGQVYEGAWIDDIEIARSRPCPVDNPGGKGLFVHRNELPAQIPRIADAGTDWVRLEFRMEPDSSLDLDRYAGIVDGLCQEGVAVLALLDYTTIPDDLDDDGNEDYDDPEDYLQHQQHFTETLESLAHHFRGNINHWEIWNEENGDQWHITPTYYARLLVAVSDTLKTVDRDNRVLFGGLDHVWETSQYLEPVYEALDGTWAGARPFDILAVHPYFTKVGDQFFLDPKDYLWDGGDPAETILDPYLDLMGAKGDGDKDIWITEIGWNSALDNPAIENCPGMKSWCVTRSAQSSYLADSFDILFDQVEDPFAAHDRVKTVVWYQYQDTAWSTAEMVAKMPFLRNEITADPQAICPADWGLVDGNRVPKPTYWAYQIYPQRAISWTLDAFSATPLPGAVLLAWQTVTETSLLGFNLHRAGSSGGPRTQLNASLIPVHSLEGLAAGGYEYLDAAATGGQTYFYFLEGVSSASPTLIYGPVRATAGEEPVLSAANDGPTPLGSPTTLTATVSGGIEVLTYTWAFGDGWAGAGAVVSHTYTETGSFAAVVMASTKVSELVATTTVRVDELISGLVALNDGPTALGESTTLSATVQAGSNVGYLWNFGDSRLGLGALVSHTYPGTGVYTALVTATNSVGERTASTRVEIGPPPSRYRYLPLVLRGGPPSPSGRNSRARR